MRWRLASTGLILFAAIAIAQRGPAPAPFVVPENAVTHVSEHVYAIVGNPDIGIVVGNRATLVVDTGLGPRNGAVVMREVNKLAKNPILYLTTTHYHAEHTAGEAAFPPNTILVRNAVQQEDVDQRAEAFIDRFRNMSPLNHDLLEGVKVLRKPDIVFDKELTLDLGGVHARLFWMGPAHTRGDEMIFVEEDQTLISGDIVQNKIVPALYTDEANVKSWLAILDKLEAMHPRFVVPDHGRLGDGSLVGMERAFLLDLQTRSLELKKQGKSVEDASRILTEELKMKYPDWDNLNLIPNGVRRVFAENQ